MQAAHAPASLELGPIAGCLEMSRGHSRGQGPGARPVPPVGGGILLHSARGRRELCLHSLTLRALLPLSLSSSPGSSQSGGCCHGAAVTSLRVRGQGFTGPAQSSLPYGPGLSRARLPGLLPQRRTGVRNTPSGRNLGQPDSGRGRSAQRQGPGIPAGRPAVESLSGPTLGVDWNRADVQTSLLARGPAQRASLSPAG